MIIDNRPGGNGIVGMGIGANATPDGYTLLHGTIGPVAVTPEAFGDYIKSEIAKYGQVVKAAGVRID